MLRYTGNYAKIADFFVVDGIFYRGGGCAVVFSGKYYLCLDWRNV